MTHSIDRPRRRRTITHSDGVTLNDIPRSLPTSICLPAFGGPYAVPEVRGPFVQLDSILPTSRGISIRVKVLDRLLALQHTGSNGEQITITEWTVGDQSGCISLRASGLLSSALYAGMDATIVNASVDVVEGRMRVTLGVYSSVHLTDPVKSMHSSVIKKHHNCSSKVTVPRYLF